MFIEDGNKIIFEILSIFSYKNCNKLMINKWK